MKSVHLKIAFCGFLCLAVDSQWNAALGVLTPEEAAHRGSHAPAPHKPAPKPISKPPGLEQKNEPGPGQRRRRKSDPAPEAKGEGKEGPKPGVPGEARPHEAPKVGGEFHKPLPGKAFGIISERATLRFRHALFSHRWSFNYAPELKHAAKQLRFFLDGHIETEVRGERWYWNVEDDGKVRIRSVLDERNPGILVAFDPGYTGFQYTVPNQTAAAVQGSQLETVEEAEGQPLAADAARPETVAVETAAGPAAPAAPDGGPSLEQALLSHDWIWNGGPIAHFKPDGTLRNPGHRIMLHWKVTGPRTFVVSKGAESSVFTMDESLSQFQGTMFKGAEIVGTRSGGGNQ